MVSRHVSSRTVAAFFAWIATGGTVLAAAGDTEPVAALSTMTNDVTPPTVTGPVQTIAKGKVGSAVPITLKWTAEDASGIKSYELWRSTNAGIFVRDTQLAPTATSRTYWLRADNSYRFFVRA